MGVVLWKDWKEVSGMHFYRCSLVQFRGSVVISVYDKDNRKIKDFFVEAKTKKEADGKALQYLSSRMDYVRELIRSEYTLFIGKEIDASQIIR